MSDEKLLHVSCIVKQPFIWDLLRVLEMHKVGNVEVRPVAPLLALPAPEHNTIRARTLAAMPLDETITPAYVTEKTGISVKQAGTTLWLLKRDGIIRRVSFGKYRRKN
jgi:hypothetical protein